MRVEGREGAGPGRERLKRWTRFETEKGKTYCRAVFWCQISSMSISRPDVPAIAGEWRRPHNDLQNQEVEGGHKAIHDDETARAAGFA